MSTTKILFFGDIVGRPGREAIQGTLPTLMEKHSPDFVIANAENIAGGSGITSKTLSKIFHYGVNACSTGDHVFRNKEFHQVIDDERVVRPANYPETALGKGWRCFDLPNGVRLLLMSLQGRIFLEPHNCPFITGDNVVAEAAQLEKPPQISIVDFHAEATSEKIALGRFLDGKVSAVLGTHTHVQTADEQILPQGTAYLTDLGMTGPHDGIIGREVKPVLQKLTTGMPARFEVAKHGRKACGVVIQFDNDSGNAIKIERFQESIPDETGDTPSPE